MNRRLVFFSILFLGLLTSAYTLDVSTRSIQDDSSLRISIKDTWLTEAPGKVLEKSPWVHTLPGGDRIQVRAEGERGECLIILARELGGTFPGWAQGSWVLTRRRDTGLPERIRIFLRSDPYVYVQFRPFTGDKSLMDVVVYDAYVVHSQPLAIPFERLLVIPVEDALRTAGASFPRRYFDPDPGMYRELREFIALVRQRLPELRFRDDGAIDEQGRYVFIENLALQDGPGGLNCSGFAKWIVDGILRPRTGERLTIPPLKEPFGDRTSSFSEAYERLRDPFFGLDWTRNLAAAAGNFGTLEEIEVQKGSFASVIRRKEGKSSIRAYPGFLQNAGFDSEGIHPLLYTLAVDEPGFIYLASVNQERGPAPRMRQHFHVAVLVPYFTEAGNFRIALFESAAETSFTNFKTRYPGHHINLVRIPVEGTFDP
ncbi:hypothetical protein LQZ21_08650 [Treponema sp. TIM-1]|uniref:hypothetical protein n=1 Tax=Treponema sp. TIM-1 TaxID=2898417 RepID=UPI00397F85EE